MFALRGWGAARGADMRRDRYADLLIQEEPQRGVAGAAVLTECAPCGVVLIKERHQRGAAGVFPRCSSQRLAQSGRERG